MLHSPATLLARIPAAVCDTRSRHIPSISFEWQDEPVVHLSVCHCCHKTDDKKERLACPAVPGRAPRRASRRAAPFRPPSALPGRAASPHVERRYSAAMALPVCLPNFHLHFRTCVRGVRAVRGFPLGSGLDRRLKWCGIRLCTRSHKVSPDDFPREIPFGHIIPGGFHSTPPPPIFTPSRSFHRGFLSPAKSARPENSRAPQLPEAARMCLVIGKKRASSWGLARAGAWRGPEPRSPLRGHGPRPSLQRTRAAGEGGGHRVRHRRDVQHAELGDASKRNK